MILLYENVEICWLRLGGYLARCLFIVNLYAALQDQCIISPNTIFSALKTIVL